MVAQSGNVFNLAYMMNRWIEYRLVRSNSEIEKMSFVISYFVKIAAATRQYGQDLKLSEYFQAFSCDD